MTSKPHTVPDPEGELYDREMAKVRAQREAEDRGLRISRPNTLQSFIPVIGPAWEAAADFQDGDYAGGAFNTAMAVADLLPVGVAVKGARAASKGIGILKKGSVSGNAAAKQLRARGLAGPGQQIHHTIPLNGKSRTAQDPRNHYALLKVMPTEQHRRLTGSWNGKPRYNAVQRVWYGTNDWQKIAPTSVAASVADGVDAARRPNATKR
jgi:hypothetical protein